ncbi:hypothetical protein [Actinoplanes rectilineatus]|uniref:hypothetical protein n=1 Tax=Actinoplanes rectilineatus TaxID=113571 RepID=UPI0005F2D924|nr:hypothetical protein [Actinoplanes rectilineatus]
MRWRYLWAALVLLVVAAGTVVLTRAGGTPDLDELLTARMRDTLEQSSPDQHQHAGYQAGSAPVICGVRVYGYEPSGAAGVAEVRTVYGFHLCGVAEPNSPWDIAVKLAGPVILDMSTDPTGIQVVEATEQIRYADRLRQMFPPKYAEVARTEALTETEMADLRRRYDTAAGLS